MQRFVPCTSLSIGLGDADERYTKLREVIGGLQACRRRR